MLIGVALWALNWWLHGRHVDPYDTAQREAVRLRPGLRVPLRTGGAINVEVPINRFESDSTSALLNPSYTSDLAVTLTQAAGVEPAEVGLTMPVWPSKVTFDLARFQAVDGDPELEMVYRYLSSIQVRRQDFNGRVLTIRADDIRAIAGLFGTDADALLRRLDDLQLRLQPA